MRKSHKKWGACIVRIRARGAASIAIRDPFSVEEGGRGRGYPPHACKQNKGPANAEPMSKHKPYLYLI